MFWPRYALVGAVLAIIAIAALPQSKQVPDRAPEFISFRPCGYGEPDREDGILTYVLAPNILEWRIRASSIMGFGHYTYSQQSEVCTELITSTGNTHAVLCSIDECMAKLKR